MTKIDYEKDHRKQRAKVRDVKKPGTVSDFAGEDQQDELVALQNANSQLKLPPQLIPKFKLVRKCIKQINSGHYLSLSDAEKTKFLAKYFAAHNDMCYFGNNIYGYEKTTEYRISARFLESVSHLIDKRKYWNSR